MMAVAGGRIGKLIPFRGFLEHLRIQRRFFLSYMLVLIAPLMVGLLLYPSAARVIERNELESRTLLTQNCVSAMEHVMRRVDDTLVELSRDTALNRLLLLQPQPDYGSPQASLVYEAHDTLSSRLSYAKLPADIVIYLTRPDLTLDGSSVVYGRERFYELAISYENLPYNKFKSEILSAYHYRRAIGPVTVLRKKNSINNAKAAREEGFLYLQTLPVVGGLQNNLGTAVVHIGPGLLAEWLRMPADDPGSTFMTDADFSVLTGQSGEYTSERLVSLNLSASSGSMHDTIDGKRMLITYARSIYNGWYCISAAPLSGILRSLQTLRVILMASLSGILLLGVALAFIFSRSSARPYEEALSQLSRVTRRGATPDDLHTAVRALLSDQEEMRKALDRARLASRENFLEELLRGELNDDDAILDKAASLGIDLQGKSYCVAVLALPREPESIGSDVVIMLSEHASRGMKSARVYAHAMPRQRIGLVCCFDTVDERGARSAVAELTRAMMGIERLGLKITGGMRCCAGGLVERPSFLCVSYSEAEAALMADAPGALAGGTRRPPTHYREVARHGRGFVYPGEIETKMTLLCSGGDKARLNETLDYLYEENFMKRGLDRRMAYALFCDMYATLIQIAGTLNISWLPQSFFSMRMATLDNRVEFDRVRACYDRLADLHMERLEADSPQAAASNSALEMEQYIREHYARSDLSVSVMASRFNVSETYFSEYFKRGTGQTFSVFLETNRINNACLALRQTDHSVEDIAVNTGYTNALSFRRAFKKVTGVSPSEYRRGMGTG